jgi:translation machinery-associated protein 16
MPKSLEKTRKKIAKKKGNITALHENSRDSQRLRRAQMRDDKLVKVASLRRKNDQPLSELAHTAGCLIETDGLKLKEQHTSKRLFERTMDNH